LFVPADEKALQAIVDAYVRALNAHDVDAIVALFAEDATVEDPVGTEPQRGREAIRAFFSRVAALRVQVRREGQVRACGRECAFAIGVSLVHEGTRSTFYPIDTFRLDEAGKIAQMRAYFGPSNVTIG